MIRIEKICPYPHNHTLSGPGQLLKDVHYHSKDEARIGGKSENRRETWITCLNTHNTANLSGNCFFRNLFDFYFYFRNLIISG